MAGAKKALPCGEISKKKVLFFFCVVEAKKILFCNKMADKNLNKRRVKMKAKRKEKLMKGFLMFFVCFCFVGFSETLQANEQEYREACDGGDLSGCYQLGWLEKDRGKH